VIAFVVAFFYNPRALLLVAPFMVVGFSKAFKTLKHKRFWYLLIAFYGLFFFQQYIWVVLEIGC